MYTKRGKSAKAVYAKQEKRAQETTRREKEQEQKDTAQSEQTSFVKKTFSQWKSKLSGAKVEGQSSVKNIFFECKSKLNDAKVDLQNKSEIPVARWVHRAAYASGSFLGYGSCGIKKWKETQQKVSKLFEQGLMLYGFFVYSVHILEQASPSGQISPELALKYYKRIFPEDAAQDMVKNICQRPVKIKPRVYDAFEKFLNRKLNSSSKQELVRILLAFVREGGAIEEQELAIVRKIAQSLGMSDQNFEKLFSSFDPERKVVSQESMYEILGIDPNSSAQDMHRAYRKMSAIYHPDRYMQKSPEEQAEATKRFMKVGEAYKRLKV